MAKLKELLPLGNDLVKYRLNRDMRCMISIDKELREKLRYCSKMLEIPMSVMVQAMTYIILEGDDDFANKLKERASKIKRKRHINASKKGEKVKFDEVRRGHLYE